MPFKKQFISGSFFLLAFDILAFNLSLNAKLYPGAGTQALYRVIYSYTVIHTGRYTQAYICICACIYKGLRVCRVGTYCHITLIEVSEILLSDVKELANLTKQPMIRIGDKRNVFTNSVTFGIWPDTASFFELKLSVAYKHHRISSSDTA